MHQLFMSYSTHCCSAQASAHPHPHRWPATNKHTPMSLLLLSTQQAHTNVPIAGQHQTSTHLCLHCWSALNKHTHTLMSPLLASTRQSHTHVSIAGQHPTSTHIHDHTRLHCWPAPNQHTAMSKLLLSAHGYYTSGAPAENQNRFPYKAGMAAGPLPDYFIR